MSRLFEALRQSELQGTPREPVGLEDVSSVLSTDLLNRIEGEGLGLEQVRSVPLRIPSENGVVALTDEYGVAAEKFRLLATTISVGFFAVQLVAIRNEDGRLLRPIDLNGLRPAPHGEKEDRHRVAALHERIVVALEQAEMKRAVFDRALARTSAIIGRA